jgi:trigger factor
MQLSIQQGEGLIRYITAELSSEDIEPEVEKRLKNLTRTAHLKGFRPGKVPYKIIHERYATQVHNEIFNEQIENIVNNVIEEQKWRLVATPVVNKETKQNDGKTIYSFVAVCEIFPNITLNSLDSYTVTRYTAQITDADVEEMIENFRYQRRTWTVVDRPAQLGDKVLISMHIGEGADKLLKQIEKVPIILGNGTVLKELEIALIGTTIGETKTAQLPLTDKENANQTMTVCNMTIHEIAEPVLPEYNANFIKSFDIPSGDINDLRRDVRKNMEASLIGYIRNNIKWQLMNVLLKAHQITLPNILIEFEKESLKADVNKDKQRNNIPDTWIEQQAKRKVALRLIIGEIMRQHSITLDAGRVQTTIQTIASGYEDPETIFKYYRDPENLKAIQNLVLEDQTMDWILTQVQVKEELSTFQKITQLSMDNIESSGILLSAYPHD